MCGCGLHYCSHDPFVLQHGSEINNVLAISSICISNHHPCVWLHVPQYSHVRHVNCIRYILFMSCGNSRYHGIWWEWLLALIGLLSIFSVCLCLNFIEFQIVFSYMLAACCKQTAVANRIHMYYPAARCDSSRKFSNRMQFEFLLVFLFIRGSLRYRQWGVLHVSYIKFIILLFAVRRRLNK